MMDSENNNVEKQEPQKNTPLIPQEPTNENQTTPANDAHVEQPSTTAEIATQHKEEQEQTNTQTANQGKAFGKRRPRGQRRNQHQTQPTQPQNILLAQQQSPAQQSAQQFVNNNAKKNKSKQWVPLEHQVGPAPYRPPRGGPDARRGEGRDRNRARMPRDATAPAPQNANPTFTTDNSGPGRGRRSQADQQLPRSPRRQPHWVIHQQQPPELHLQPGADQPQQQSATSAPVADPNTASTDPSSPSFGASRRGGRGSNTGRGASNASRHYGGRFVPPGNAYYWPYDTAYVNATILQQLEYYLSKENLVRDFHLRKFMDDDGFVPLGVIAEFPRMSQLGVNSFILATVAKESTDLIVNDQKIRSILIDPRDFILPQNLRLTYTPSTLGPEQGSVPELLSLGPAAPYGDY